jgi:hypothetical protein
MRKTAAVSLLSYLLAVSLAAGLAAPEQARTAAGTIARVQASQRTIALTLTDGTEAVFVWNADTKISGVLQPGAKVTIRYAPASDGKNLAQQISVSRS